MPVTFTGPYPTNFGGVTSAMLISATTFSGGVTNTGTIGAGGIDVVGSMLLSGGIIDTGVDIGGIRVDSGSSINANATAIAVKNTTTFAGGINNAGSISTLGFGILLRNAVVGNTGEGITNSGTISARQSGIRVENAATFAGGIGNGGNITAQLARGIVVIGGFSLFGNTSVGGGIGNTGVISAGNFGIGVGGSPSGTFAGGISNGGTISAGNCGIFLTNVVVFGNSSTGGVINNGSISAGTSGLVVASVQTFTGSILNRAPSRLHRAPISIFNYAPRSSVASLTTVSWRRRSARASTSTASYCLAAGTPAAASATAAQSRHIKQASRSITRPLSRAGSAMAA
jgi:hypothetical protein